MNITTKLSLLLALGLSSSAASFADTTTQTTVVTTNQAPVVVVRDGFSESYAQVMVTRNGVTSVVADNMKLQNGVVIRPDGIIIVPGVTNKTLHHGDWLSFDAVLTRGDSGRVEYLRPER
jgi:hypothetical protein